MWTVPKTMSDEPNKETPQASSANTGEKVYRTKPAPSRQTATSRRPRQPILIAFQPPEDGKATERPYKGSKLPPKINISAPPKNSTPSLPAKTTPASHNEAHVEQHPMDSNWGELCEDSTVHLIEAAFHAFPGLIKELKSLRADRARLDWLEQCAQLDWSPEDTTRAQIEFESGEPFFKKQPTLREVIDNARKQGK